MDLKDVDKLRKVKFLTALTLHGNPIENLPAFRHYILNRLPSLKHLNFSGISKADRQTASVWTKSNNAQLSIIIKNNDEKPKTTDIDND